MRLRMQGEVSVAAGSRRRDARSVRASPCVCAASDRVIHDAFGVVRFYLTVPDFLILCAYVLE